MGAGEERIECEWFFDDFTFVVVKQSEYGVFRYGKYSILPGNNGILPFLRMILSKSPLTLPEKSMILPKSLLILLNRQILLK